VHSAYHIQFPSWAAWNNSWSLFVILSVFRTTSSWVGKMSLLPQVATLSVPDSATAAEKSEFDGDSTASVGVMSALLAGGTLTNTPQRKSLLRLNEGRSDLHISLSWARDQLMSSSTPWSASTCSFNSHVFWGRPRGCYQPATGWGPRRTLILWFRTMCAGVSFERNIKLKFFQNFYL